MEQPMEIQRLSAFACIQNVEVVKENGLDILRELLNTVHLQLHKRSDLAQLKVELMFKVLQNILKVRKIQKEKGVVDNMIILATNIILEMDRDKLDLSLSGQYSNAVDCLEEISCMLLNQNSAMGEFAVEKDQVIDSDVMGPLVALMNACLPLIASFCNRDYWYPSITGNFDNTRLQQRLFEFLKKGILCDVTVSYVVSSNTGSVVFEKVVEADFHLDVLMSRAPDFFSHLVRTNHVRTGGASPRMKIEVPRKIKASKIVWNAFFEFIYTNTFSRSTCIAMERDMSLLHDLKGFAEKFDAPRSLLDVIEMLIKQGPGSDFWPICEDLSPWPVFHDVVGMGYKTSVKIACKPTIDHKRDTNVITISNKDATRFPITEVDECMSESSETTCVSKTDTTCGSGASQTHTTKTSQKRKRETHVEVLDDLAEVFGEEGVSQEEMFMINTNAIALYCHSNQFRKGIIDGHKRKAQSKSEENCIQINVSCRRQVMLLLCKYAQMGPKPAFWRELCCNWTRCAQLMVHADKWGMHKLKFLCECALKNSLRTDTVTVILLAAHRASAWFLWFHCLLFVVDLEDDEIDDVLQPMGPLESDIVKDVLRFWGVRLPIKHNRQRQVR